MDNYKSFVNGKMNPKMQKVLDNFVKIFKGNPVDSYRLKAYLKQFVMNNTSVSDFDFRGTSERVWLSYVKSKLEWSD